MILKKLETVSKIAFVCVGGGGGRISQINKLEPKTKENQIKTITTELNYRFVVSKIELKYIYQS